MNSNSRQGISNILLTTRTSLKNQVVGHALSNQTNPKILDEVNDILNRMAVLQSKLDHYGERTNVQFQEGEKAGEPVIYRIDQGHAHPTP